MKKLDPKTFPTVIDECNKWDRETKTHIAKTLSAPIFEKGGNIYCYSEDGPNSEGAIFFSDYDGEFRGNVAWISEDLEKWARKYYGKNAYWEWEHKGMLSLSL
jgi:hypothetical protein